MISKKLSKSVLKAGLNVAIFGPSGYTGHEIIRLLLKHPKVKIKLLSAGVKKIDYVKIIDLKTLKKPKKKYK